ncbi:hypothetical protein HDU67_005310 [Dinochytrium kinnereticum]|nr:hypothetical protein HDU67_005310 [Dinochytrium kinnereticum]
MLFPCLVGVVAVAVACHARIVEHFLLNHESITSGGVPRYERTDVNKLPWRQLKAVEDASNSSSPLGSSTSEAKDSITVILDCDLFDVAWITEQERNHMCSMVQLSFERAMKRISAVVLLTSPITVSVSFHSYCRRERRWEVDGDDSKPCLWSGSLGSAAPYSWNTFDKNTADNLGLDSEYMYPSALARQYAPQDPSFLDPSMIDISAAFNADAPWWFGSDIDNSGEDIAYDFQSQKDKGSYSWGYFEQVPNEMPPYRRKVFDLEQVAIHEVMHGLGIISAWYEWFNPETLMPGYPMLAQPSVSNNYTALTLAKSYIFDKFLYDSRSGVWMKYYSNAIRKDIEKLSKELWPPNTPQDSISWSAPPANNFTDYFARVDGWKLASYIRNVAVVTPRGLSFWYPTPSIRGSRSRWTKKAVGKQWRYVVLYSPLAYSGGSTISHLDASFYAGTSEYLMRPFGTAGASSDTFSPKGKYGPVGEALLGMLRAMGYVTAIGPIN